MSATAQSDIITLFAPAWINALFKPLTLSEELGSTSAVWQVDNTTSDLATLNRA